jgi:hypothetical protein
MNLRWVAPVGIWSPWFAIVVRLKDDAWCDCSLGPDLFLVDTLSNGCFFRTSGTMQEDDSRIYLIGIRPDSADRVGYYVQNQDFEAHIFGDNAKDEIQRPKKLSRYEGRRPLTPIGLKYNFPASRPRPWFVSHSGIVSRSFSISSQTFRHAISFVNKYASSVKQRWRKPDDLQTRANPTSLSMETRLIFQPQHL